MAARGPYYADKDAWVAQLVGGSTEYGNGTGTLIHFGPVPQAGGGADFKSRGLFEIAAADMAALLSGASAITSATVTLTVGTNACMSSRGATTRLFLEELTADFGEKSTSGDCNLSSGSGSAVWGISDNSITTNRASFSGASLGFGDTITFDVTAMVQNRLTNNDTSALRFRVISANSGLTGYDETTSARRISVFSREHVTAADIPQLSAVIATGSVAKGPFVETGTASSTFSVSQTGTSPVFTETGVGADVLVAGAIATWSTALDDSGNGRALLSLPTPNQDNFALLNTTDVQDIQLRCMFQVDKLPVGGTASFMLLARALSKINHYRARVQMGGADQSMSIYLEKMVAGVVTDLQHVLSIRTLLAGSDYWLKLQVQGINPTVLNAKFWLWGEAEPGWILQVSDSEAGLQITESMGMGGRISSTVTNAPITLSMDQFEGYAP